MPNLLSLINFIPKRFISLSACREGKRNFRKFMVINKRGTRIFKKNQASKLIPEIPIDTRGVRPTGYIQDGRFVNVPEMIPEFIVPDLTNCNLKPYVSYRTPEVHQSEFTAEDLFNVIYAEKILSDFKAGKLDDEGNPLEPSAQEKLSSEEAYLNARITGSDIFESK